MDIDKVILDVLQWQATLETVNKERNALLQENDSMRATIESLTTSEQNAQQEIEALKDTLNVLQLSFLRKYDYKEECGRLKDEIKKLEEKGSAEKEQFEKRIRESEENIKLSRKEHMDEMEKVSKEWRTAKILLEDRLNEEIEQWRDKAGEETRRCEEISREKDGKIAMIKIDFDGKIKRLQEQHVRLQNKASSGATGNDIFRKKLQYEREISTRRIKDLEEEIEQLTIKLATKDTAQQSFISGYSRHIANTARPPFKRRKVN